MAAWAQIVTFICVCCMTFAFAVERAKRFDSNNFMPSFGKRIDPANFMAGFGKRLDQANYMAGFGKR